MATKSKRLIKGRDPMLMGVCGGLADYLDIDVTVVRLLWVIGTIFVGGVPGVIAYIIAGLIIPEK